MNDLSKVTKIAGFIFFGGWSLIGSILYLKALIEWIMNLF